MTQSDAPSGQAAPPAKEAPPRRLVVSLLLEKGDRFHHDEDNRGQRILVAPHRHDPAVLECFYEIEPEPKKRKGDPDRIHAVIEIVTDSSLFFLGQYKGAIVYRQAEEEEIVNCMVFVGPRGIARARGRDFDGARLLEQEVITLLEGHVVALMFKPRS